MKKMIIVWLLLGPIFVAAESIQNFNVVIDVNIDGSINVTEKITYDFKNNQKRGIYRVIPKTYQFENEIRQLEIELLGISRNGQMDTREITDGSKDWHLRIGKEDVFVSGVHEYEITYKVLGALRYYSDIDELYWNVTGDKWTVPIKNWGAFISLPQETSIVQKACYRGARGEVGECVILESPNKRGVSFQDSKTLSVGEGATIAVGFTPDVVAEVVLKKKEPNWFVLLGVIGALVYYIKNMIAIKRKHYKKKSIIAQYETHDDYSAMFTGYIIDGQLNNRDIVAGIIELAQNGYITITQYGKDTLLQNYGYIFELKRQLEDELTEAQKSLLELVFGSSPVVGVTYDTKKTTSLKTSQVRALQKAVVRQQTERELNESVKYPWKTVFITLIVIILSMVATFGLTIIAFAPVLFTVIWFFLIPLFVIKRTTIKGYDAKNHILGLKKYIEVAEKERITFHDAPEKNPETFSKYLPYAIAFKLEEKWAKEFENMDIEVDWFNSPNGSIVNPVVLRNALSGVGSSISKAMPSSSSSSSGSGGGGFSGGGGGGGGGGSW